MRWWESALDLFAEATAGHKEVPSNWMSATGLRALIQEDPCLLWLKYHGAAHGFEQDLKEYSFLEFIGEKGRQFEAAWIKNVCPDAVPALDEDVDVRRVQGLMKTLELIDKKVPVITKAALWWAPEKIYGSSDLIVLTSWLYKRFPQLKPQHAVPDHYVVLDCKFSTGLEDADHKIDLAMNSAQIRMYSYMLGHIQGHMAQTAYLVTRDRPFYPLPVSVDRDLNAPLNPELAHLRDLHLHIRHHGHQYTPWTHEIVAANPSNQKDDPWHGAKKKILTDYIPGGALQLLPHIGNKQAEELKSRGYESVGHLLTFDSSGVPFEKIRGIGKTTAPRIRAVLEANRTNSASAIHPAILPPRKDIELYVDYEYFTNINVNFDSQWPDMAGCEMIFMIGVGWEDGGNWQYRQFVAEREDNAAERKLFEEFLAFLEACGVFRAHSSAALYHWSNAEVWQSKRAAERLSLDHLACLPWCDLQKPFHAGPVAFPGAWEFGLKPVAKALGAYSPEHAVEWPDELAAGLAAMIMGWEMYEQPEPLQSKEFAPLSQYLEIDCKAMWQVLRWLRKAAVEVDVPASGGWYSRAKPAKKERESPSRQPKKSPSKKRRSRRRSSLEESYGWYRQAALVLTR